MLNFRLKRVLVLVCLLSLILIITSCSKNKALQKFDFEPEKFTLEDLSIYDADTDKLISIGMDKNEVEGILGKSGSETEQQKIYKYNNYNGLSVFYRDNKVAAVALLGDEDNSSKARYKTIRNINLDFLRKDVEEAYGEQPTANVSYMLIKKGDTLEYIKDSHSEALKNIDFEMNKVYYISFMFKSKSHEEISNIIIGDSDYIMKYE